MFVAIMATDYNPVYAPKSLDSYIELLDLANISVTSEFAGIYMTELVRLSLRALEKGFEDAGLWQEVHQHTQIFLVEFPDFRRPPPKGSHGNPVSGRIKGFEFLACILQPAGSEQADQLDGLKMLLIQLFIKSGIAKSHRAEIPNEIRLGRQFNPPYRLEVFQSLPSIIDPHYCQQLALALQKNSVQPNLNYRKKPYIRSLGRLIGLSLCESKARGISQVTPGIVADKNIRPRVKAIRPVSVPGSLSDGREPSGLYEIIERPEDPDSLAEEPPESNILFQQIVDQQEFAFDVALQQKRKQSAYWLEQATLVSPFNSGLLIPPERHRLCSVLRENLNSDDALRVFSAGLIALSYLTSLSISDLVRDLAGNWISAECVYIRRIPQPESAYTPAEGDISEWLAPLSKLLLPLPDELSNWLKTYVNPVGRVSKSTINSEAEVLAVCKEIFEEARDDGRYNLTESSVRNALKRHLATTTLGALAVYLLAGSETERPPVISHYACVTAELLQASYREVLKKLWL